MDVPALDRPCGGPRRVWRSHQFGARRGAAAFFGALRSLSKPRRAGGRRRAKANLPRAWQFFELLSEPCLIIKGGPTA
jgi:hypothetical protein